MFLKPHSIVFFLVAIAATLISKAQISDQQIRNFANTYEARCGIPASEIIDILKQAEFQQKIIDRMDRPAEAMPWYRYRKIFMSDERIAAGREFITQNNLVLSDISKTTGVPVEIMAAIIGVETYFGRNKGTYKVLDALSTLAFGYPRRSKFFQTELAEFIKLTQEEELDIFSLKGSYAGAIGYCQFMPSSYRAYAKSYDQGTRDLVNSVEDAILSVGNYLDVHRWQTGKPIATKAHNMSGNFLEKQSLKPRNSLSHYISMGFEPQDSWSSDTRTTLLEFETEDGVEYWFGSNNFYVITRYNHSPLYALAVFQLAEAIKDHQP